MFLTGLQLQSCHSNISNSRGNVPIDRTNLCLQRHGMLVTGVDSLEACVLRQLFMVPLYMIVKLK